jgi:hypothetical protein
MFTASKYMDPIQNEVDRFNFTESLKNRSSAILIHYLFGTKANPYKTRKTNVYINKQSFLSTAGNNDNNDIKHKIIMQEYIQYIDRDNTVLKLAVDKFTELNTPGYPDIQMLIINIEVNDEAKGINDLDFTQPQLMSEKYRIWPRQVTCS